MKIEVFFRHNDVKPKDIEGRHIVVIDVLRATTVIATALGNGAASVRTVAEVTEAFQIKENRPDVLLAGERDALKVSGFRFGNSPLEMKNHVIQDKHIVMTTSNGTKAVAIASGAKSIRLASFVNMAAVVEDMLQILEDFAIICSGTNGQFSLDDVLAAGILVNRLKKKTEVVLTDSSILAALAVKDETQLSEYLKDCFHLNVLKDRGFQADIDYCLSLDILDVVPLFVNGEFII